MNKFRAWDKEANIMVYSDHRTRKLYDVYYGFEMNGQGELECRWEGEFTESHVLDGGTLDNLMQYTGLKDKNGVEIYEGDIVKVNEKDVNSDTRLKDIYHVLVVEYFKEEVGFILKNKKTVGKHFGRLEYMVSEKCFEQCEIIGNIYENKDLIEVEE